MILYRINNAMQTHFNIIKARAINYFSFTSPNPLVAVSLNQNHIDPLRRILKYLETF
jgi:hypothetical protein